MLHRSTFPLCWEKDGIAGINRPARRQRAFLDSEIEGIPTFCSFECFL